MVLPPGHAQSLRAGRRLRTRERWMIGTVLGAATALLAAIVIAFGTSSPSSGHGCIHLVLPAATGAQEIDQCGAAARTTCASVNKRSNFTPQAARSAAAECRKAGLSAGR